MEFLRFLMKRYSLMRWVLHNHSPQLITNPVRWA